MIELLFAENNELLLVDLEGSERFKVVTLSSSTEEADAFGSEGGDSGEVHRLLLAVSGRGCGDSGAIASANSTAKSEELIIMNGCDCGVCFDSAVQ